jgi:chromosome segregation protein
MILSKIVCHGFKSFAKKLELRFDGRITAIVGPNGCGKTNIVDAIRWGLGEQRPTVLRTDRMENIIFGGAHSSKPLGMAEVSVYFDNSSHILPIDYNEVVVTRRLYRSGESDYLLNKNMVRLKDINDLIMDTGIGADAYSVIELKMVEDILSDRVEDRRKLLEEAAGVTKYKHRLRAAMRKLDATHNDLLRVNDIIQEVERSVSSLKRQVQKAKRYQVYQEKIKELELRLGSQILVQLIEKISPLKENLTSLKKLKEGKTTKITTEEADLEALKLQMVDREKAMVQVREELASSVERIHRREGDIRVNRERIASLEERIVRYTSEIKELEKRLDEQRTHQEITQRERQALQVKITSTGRIFNNKQKELEVFQQGLNLKRLDLNGKKKDIIVCLEEYNSLIGEETQFRTKIDNSQGRLERLDEEDKGFQESQKRVTKTQKELDTIFRSLEAKRSIALQVREKTVSEMDKIDLKLDTSREQLYREKSELELLHGRLAFFRTVIESREGITDGARKLLKKEVAGLTGMLADLLKFKSAHRRAIEVGLGETAQYLLFDKESQAIAALNSLRKWGGGKVSLVGLDRAPKTVDRKDRQEVPEGAGVIGWAEDLVKCDAKIRPVVGYILKDLIVVKDLKAAQKIVQVFADKGVRAATLDGEMVTGWGVIQTGESKEKEVGLVGRRQWIKELDVKAKTLENKIAESKKKLHEDETKRAALLVQKEKNDRALNDLDEKKLTAEKRQAKVRFEEEIAEQGVLANVRERQKLLKEIEKGRDSLEDLRPRMESLKEKREKIEKLSGLIQAEVDRLEEGAKVKEEEVHRLNISQVRLKGDARNLDYDIEHSQQLIKEIIDTKDHRSQEILDAGEQIQRYKKESDDNEQALVEDYSVKEKEESVLHEREQSYQELMQEVQSREKEVRVVRRTREEASEGVHNVQMEISELEFEVKSLKDRILESYEVDLEKVKPQEDIDGEQADLEVEELKRKMKMLGPVNLMALKEYEHDKERADFLNRQRQDLLSAEEILNETIQKINSTARRRFREVFFLVRNNFRKTFSMFFQGGEADLMLPENEDPLEAQIEITARPAGKHFRDLSLLSGGERALTAIALLFALYLVKPSPFCILDEIDAPLDDANIERFTRVLTEFAEKTQFIIVTHNKMTMKVAKTLYGVTMEEEGVSKIVSVKFGDGEKER